MGGKSKGMPEPTKFTPPPIDNSPATNPIPNFFASRAPGGPQPQSPYQQFQWLQERQQQGSPFQTGAQVSPEIVELLLKKIRGGR